MDIDPERLRTSEIVASKLVAAHGAQARVEATLDRRQALEGADYVVTSFQVGGLRPSTVVDFEIPKRFGLRQTIADTLGVGGIMRALRTIPVLLDVCRDMEELCPDALLLNYVNPMAMLCWAVAESSPIRTVGLCHSVQHTAGELAADLGLPAEELNYHVAGINHVAFFLRLERDGESLYPALRRVLEEDRAPESNRVRYELLRHFGFFVTESSEHFAEYVPWFIKSARPDLIERFNIPLDDYLRRSERQIAEWETQRAELERNDTPMGVERSAEYGADIIRACETGDPFAFNGNVPNRHRRAPADRQPAGRLLRRGALRRNRPRHRAAARRRPPPPSRRADADQRQRPGPHRRRRATRRRARSTTPRCSTRTPPVSSRWTRSPRSSTRSSTPTATGSPRSRQSRTRR